MDKAKSELYMIKRKDLQESDKQYISGYKACIDYIQYGMLHDINTDINHMEDDNYRYIVYSIITRFLNNVGELLEDRIFHEMEQIKNSYTYRYGEMKQKITRDDLNMDDYDLDVDDSDEFDIDDIDELEEFDDE